MHSKKETGQALPLGIAFLMSTILLGLVFFNTGQTASEKSRLINAADAAVYSGLIWQARALNYQAYTNRAMIANQVSIGQMVSLTSWTKYAYIVARNIDFVGNFFPIIKPYTSMAESITETIDDVVVQIAEVFIPIVDGVNNVLSRSQQAIYMASFIATPAIVREVVERNDERYNVNTTYSIIGMGENIVGWRGFTTQYDDREGLLRKADVVNRSKDEFTESRDLSPGDVIPGAPNKLYLGNMRVWVKKEGRTNLVIEEGDEGDDNLEFEWKGKDTLSFHIETFNCDPGCGWDHEEIPLAWAARHVNGDFECEENEGSSILWIWFANDGCPRYMQENRRAEMMANMTLEELDAEYNGLRAYYDLSDLSSENRDPRLALRIEVELPENNVRTASKIDGLGSDTVPSEELRSGIGAGMFGTEDQMASDGMTTIASGELFFHPPDDYSPERRRGRYEIASLFSPYWEVHLIDTPVERKFMAWALRDADLFVEGASGVATGIDIYINQRAEELQQLLQLQESLESQLEETVDAAMRAEIESQLADVSAQISQIHSSDQITDAIASQLQQEMSSGMQTVAQNHVDQYEQQLESYANEQSEELANDFRDEIVDQVTDQLQQALEQAVEDAVENALSSIF
ncbi:MAG: pilus assembly protein TadG-related protein [Candidatus Thiodiazotropha sp.]